MQFSSAPFAFVQTFGHTMVEKGEYFNVNIPVAQFPLRG
ncbi:hypothetical protein JCM19237_6406 [Photobacterium aphoticum]|uniref:Uncharacterized protein n=1 Tax=Photobacterium aphoticum TaxID=754436 RepID=A0A090R7D0_9GAMM|nr:hypothetical protein JCM19237_6406 [Photobacterium aphoticum]